MIRVIVKYIIYIICLSLFINLNSQEIVFEKILPKDGLSQIDVLAIHQDSIGFMWFGTQEGLNMYDGYNFKVFRKSVFEKNAIASNLLIDITEDHNNNIWIATQNSGVNIYNPTSDKMEWVGNMENKPAQISNNRLRSIFCDSKNRIWITTLKGVDYIVKEKDSIIIKTINENLDPGEQNKHFAIQVVETKSNEMLIVRVKAITKIVFNENGNPANEVKLWFIDSTITEIHELKEINNGFLLGTKLGVYLLKYDKENQIKITAKISSANIYKFAIDADSNLWAGGTNGLYYFKYDNSKPALYTLSAHIKEGYSEYDLSSKFIRDIYIDKQQTVWVSTQGGGINKYNPRLRQFRKYYHTEQKGSLSNNKIQGIHEDLKGNIWIGTTGGGLNLLPKNNRKNYDNGFIKIDVNKEEQQNYVYAIIDFERNGEHVVLSGNCYYPHLTELIFKNGKWQQSNPDIKFWSYVNALHSDKYGNIWIGTYGDGIYKAKYRNNEYEYKRYNTGNSNMPSDVIRNLFEDSKGRIWIGTDNGLVLIEQYNDNLDFPEASVIKHNPDDKNSLAENFILKVAETSWNEIWIGTQGGGINILDNNWEGKGYRFKTLSMEDGLPNNVISEMLEDEGKNIWISSNMGISRYNKSDSTIRNYSINNGLQGYAFIDNGGCKLSDGELLFGGSMGFNAFYPHEIKNDTVPPKVVFTSFELMNNEINPGDVFNGRTILRKNINNTESIVLKHKENNFTVHFTALHYISPNNNQYKHILEGFDENWVLTTSAERFAKYTNLDPGTYTFKVKASNGYGIWSKENKSLTINVKAPFYNTKVFKTILIISIVLLSILFYYFRFKVVQNKNKMLEIAVQKRTAELNRKNIELHENNILLVEQKEEIDTQNNELEKHKYHLEELVNDRTAELDKALKKAQESDRLKAAFFANVSHEIRTPMNAIIGFTDLLEDAVLTAEERTEYTALVKSNSKILLKLITDIIDLSLIESDQLTISKGLFSLNEMLKSLFAHFTLYKQKAKVDYKLNISAEVEQLIVLTDEMRLEQVITNFMENAFKFTSSGLIELGAKVENNKLLIYVKDSGRGISKDKMDFIFKRFTKIENHKYDWESGLGLGLAISIRIADALGGKILVESVEEEGSEFTFCVDLDLIKPEF